MSCRPGGGIFIIESGGPAQRRSRNGGGTGLYAAAHRKNGPAAAAARHLKPLAGAGSRRQPPAPGLGPLMCCLGRDLGARPSAPGAARAGPALAFQYLPSCPPVQSLGAPAPPRPPDSPGNRFSRAGRSSSPMALRIEYAPSHRAFAAAHIRGHRLDGFALGMQPVRRNSDQP
jgi:hypothetical protein